MQELLYGTTPKTIATLKTVYLFCKSNNHHFPPASFLGPILQDIPFRKILPALTAGALYANARWHLTQDIRLSKNYIMTSFAARSREASDRLNLFYRLEEWALSPRDANRAMLIYNGRTWTYGESYQLVLKYAAWLHNEKGVRKGDVVAIDCVNGDTFMWLWMAIWSLGAKPSFINYNLTQAPLIHSVKAGDPKLIIVNESVYQRAFTEEVRQAFDDPTFCTKGSLEVVVIDRFKNDIESQGAGYRAPDSVRSGQALTDMAILIYTSGTTGFPKPAVVSWSKVHIGGSFASSWLNLKPSDIMYTVSQWISPFANATHEDADRFFLLTESDSACHCIIHLRLCWHSVYVYTPARLSVSARTFIDPSFGPTSDHPRPPLSSTWARRVGTSCQLLRLLSINSIR